LGCSACALCADHAATFVSSVAAGLHAFDAGLSVTPRGIGALVALFFVGALVAGWIRVPLVGFGFAMLGLSSFLLCRLSLQMAMGNVVTANIIAGFGTASSSCR
jgi:hypothetical protein